MTFSISHWGMFVVSEEQKWEWLLSRFWEEVCHKPRGSFAGLHDGTPCFEVETL